MRKPAPQDRPQERSSYSAPYGKRSATESQDRFVCGLDNEVLQQNKLLSHGRECDEYALFFAGRYDWRTCQIFGPGAAAETIPFPPLLIDCNVIGHLALRGTLRYFEPGHPRLAESFMTDEITAYVEAMKNVTLSVKNKRATAGVDFVSPPGQIYLPRPLQQFQYLATEAVFAGDQCIHIVGPNLINSANTRRPSETSYPAFLAEVSKALQD